VVLGLDMRFLGQKRRKKYQRKTKAIKSAASRSRFASALGRAVWPSAGFLTARVNACPSGVVADVYGVGERMPFCVGGGFLTAWVNVCSSVLKPAFLLRG
jgi:hypothetical protein